MLTPISRRQQSVQSPTRNMGSIRRIGQPSPRPPDNEAEIHPESTPIAPSLFGVPNSSNLHASGFVHCRVSRVGNGRYHFSFMTEDAESVSMVANRKAACRTSNYHLFDALRGGLDATLSKKSGHYIGKLRRDKGQPRGCYTLYNSSREKVSVHYHLVLFALCWLRNPTLTQKQEECAAYVYDIPALRQTVNEGVPPRKMQAVIQKPPKDNVRVNVPPNNRLLEHLHNGTWKHTLLIACQTRSPRFSDGVYR